MARRRDSTSAPSSFATVAVDRMPLPVHHVVVLQNVLADLEVLRLDWLWALAIEAETRLFSMGTSSGILRACRTHSTMSDLNSRIRSSPSDR